MRIVDLEVRCCSATETVLAGDTFRGGHGVDGLEFLVLTLKTDAGLSASSFGFAARSARGSGELAVAGLKPLLIGRNAFDREAIWKDFRTADRWWNHLPIYSYGPADICLWLLGAQAAGQPLFEYLGAARRELPVYCSSLVLADAAAYQAEAQAVRDAGFKAYKTHPPGRSLAEDIDIHIGVREAVGDDFALMADPVAPYTLEEAVRFGRELERLGYLWLEEPLPDEAFSALRELTRVLDIPVVGTEVLAKHPYSVAECVATRVVDAVRADVSWTGGITGVLKTARLAEAFHMNCEIHTTIMHPLELVNLHVGAAVANNSYFELLTPVEQFAFGLKEPISIDDGIATLPSGPGLGIELDWDLIDRATYKVL
ncbi:MAG: mandelate racemase [Hyphomicrobiales bacterium]|nr:mandelate racemase [Hyphomicrobiales bacterium]